MSKYYSGESIREREYNSGTMYAGKLSKLIETRSLPIQRSVIDNHACSLTLSLNVLNYIADSVTICHSPPGCIDDIFPLAYAGAKGRSLEMNIPFQWEMKNIHFCSTNMNETSIIFGGEGKLYNAIIEANKRYNPQIIFVLGSCTSAIIGDDIDSVCKSAGEEIGDSVIILPIHSHGFQTLSYSNAYDMVWDKIIKNLVQPPEIKYDDLVTCFVPASVTIPDMEEIERLLNKIELDVQFIPDMQNIDTIKALSEATLNTSLCASNAHHAMRLLKERFGMPYVQSPFVIGVDLTSKWLLEIGKMTGRENEAKQLISSEIERITPELDKLRSKFKGKTAYISANHCKTIGYTTMCQELGLDIIGAGFHMADDISLEYEKKFLNSVGDISVVVGSPLYEHLSHIKKLNPDVILAHPEIAPLFSAVGLRSKMTYNYYNQGAHAGFQGLIDTGKRLCGVMTNPITEKLFKFNRNDKCIDLATIPHLNEQDTLMYINQFNFFNSKCCGRKMGGCNHV